MDKIKVIYFIDFGGMAHYTAMLANAVAKRINVIIIGQKGKKPDFMNENIKLMEVFKFPIGNDIKRLILLNNIFIINRIKPNIIHITSAYPIITAMVWFFFAKKYPLVVTVHDPKSHIGEINQNWRNIFPNFFQNLLINKADKIIVHSEKHKTEVLKKRIPQKKIIVIPHGDYSFFLKYKKNLPSEKSILFFGRIVEYKGLKYLINAMSLILKEIPDIKVIIAGEGDFTEYEKLIAYNRLTCFEIHNRFIPDEMVAELFERTRLLVLPYIEATQSGPLHIACAFKKPVVATNVGAITEVVENGKTGLIVPPEDINALAEAIIKLLKDDALRKEMGENAYMKMKEEMSWDKISEKTIEVYNEAINNHKSKN